MIVVFCDSSLMYHLFYLCHRDTLTSESHFMNSYINSYSYVEIEFFNKLCHMTNALGGLKLLKGPPYRNRI